MSTSYRYIYIYCTWTARVNILSSPPFCSIVFLHLTWNSKGIPKALDPELEDTSDNKLESREHPN